MNTFSKNLKRLRLAKHLTQEQAAESLGVSTQTVSRWECGTTLPDVTMLPNIARLYCVTIDELYRETSVAYDNYAQRLAAIYRTTWDPEDFARADREFRKLRKSGAATPEDLRQFGILHQYMMRYCMTKAEALFDEVLSGSSGELYWRTRRQELYFMTLIGRGQENIDAQLAAIEAGSDAPEEWICLIAAYQYTEDYAHAWEWFQKAIAKFPDSAMLYVYGGDICSGLDRTEEAFAYWDKALELDPDMCDAKYSKVYCCEALGDYAQAYTLWCEICEEMERKGFDVEAARARERSAKCKAKLQPHAED